MDLHYAHGQLVIQRKLLPKVPGPRQNSGWKLRPVTLGQSTSQVPWTHFGIQAPEAKPRHRLCIVFLLE